MLPAFLDLVPEAGDALDVGCGEGRVSRLLRDRGVDVVGLDVAPRLVELAQEADSGGEYVVGSAEQLPFPDASFDAVVAFNVLMNVDDPEAAVAEARRVLRPGGQLCASIVHPFASAGSWDDDRFVVSDYLAVRGHEQRVGGLVFANVHRPLEHWFSFLQRAGLVVEVVQEVPRANLRDWNRLPMFLYLRATPA